MISLLTACPFQLCDFMKKILYLVSTLKQCGPTNQLFNIVSNLDRNIFKPMVITLSPEPKNSRWLDFESLNIEMYTLDLSRLSGFFGAKIKLKSLITEIRPVLVHSQGFRADILSSQLDIPLRVATVRNFPHVDFRMTYGYVLGAWMAWRQTNALKKMDLVVGVSEAVTHNLEKCCHLKKTVTVQNGVDSSIYKPVVSKNKLTLRTKLGLPIDSNLWVVSGHLSERKDPLFLIKIWEKVSLNSERNILVFIGGGGLESTCRDLANKMADIKVLGNVNNVSEYLMAADFYVSSSVAEGLPNAALEAMACGLPVLLSDIEPHKEIYAMSPEVGCLYTLGNECSFLKSFKVLVESDYATHRQAALDLIYSELSSVKMSSKYQGIYNNLMERE